VVYSCMRMGVGPKPRKGTAPRDMAWMPLLCGSARCGMNVPLHIIVWPEYPLAWLLNPESTNRQHCHWVHLFPPIHREALSQLLRLEVCGHRSDH
jgi:hypothetical protein